MGILDCFHTRAHSRPQRGPAMFILAGLFTLGAAMLIHAAIIYTAEEFYALPC